MVQIGLSSLAVAFPAEIRTNDFWRQHHPDLVAAVESRVDQRAWNARTTSTVEGAFIGEMRAYMDDPFRGTVERCYLSGTETSLSLEADASRRALAAANLDRKDIDLVLSGSVFGEQPGMGQAAYLLQEMGMACPGWNVGSTCASGMVGLHTAQALILAGQAERVLVSTSCNYSRFCQETDSLFWTVGDGAAAFVVTRQLDGHGILGTSMRNTSGSCGSFQLQPEMEADGRARVILRAQADAGSRMRDVSETHVRLCCEDVVERAGLRLADVDHFVFNTPTAWYMRFCARALQIDQARCIDAYPKYANIGPVLPFANLYEMAKVRGIKPGSVVLLYGIGSASNAVATLMRWGEVALA